MTSTGASTSPPPFPSSEMPQNVLNTKINPAAAIEITVNAASVALAAEIHREQAATKI